MIELRTLGALELASSDSDDVGAVLAQPRRAALLCYLALASPRGFHRRDTLFALFWPEYDAEQARHALRQSVYFLRRAMGPHTLVSRGDEELALAPEHFHCDVWRFESVLEAGRPAEALALYRGELLAGFHISAAPAFERWLDEERTRLRQRAAEAGWALAQERERAGDLAGAAEAARHAAALSPADETALRRLILLLERVGDRAAAVRAYEAFAWRLESEYELEPSAETRALVERIRADPGERRAAPGQLVQASAHPTGKGDPGVRAGMPGTVTGPASGPRRSTARTVAGAVVVLLGLAGLYLGARARDRTGALPPATAAAPGIAVLPFAVQEPALATWGEGMVDLVAIDLGGVTGLRAIESRALLARWRERVTGTEAPDLATSLEVARQAGARYAVVGNVMASGSDLLLSAGVHDVDSRRLLGTARAQGPADSIFGMVDRLTLEMLRLILRGEARDLPRIDLARVSTASLPALKSYLEAEVLFRRSQFRSAAESYARAVGADSTFALARYRLGYSRWWLSEWAAPFPNPLQTELGRYADRLPRHESAVLRAIQLREQDVWAARELIEAEARRHPDDAETWHELGELYHHSGGQVLVPPAAADRAFAKALELDSSFTPPYLHRIDHAISMGDTMGAARLLATFTHLAPESPFLGWYRLLTALAFGDKAARSEAEAVLDTTETRLLLGIALAFEGPRCCWGLAEQVLRRARGRTDRADLRPVVVRELFWVSLAQGKTREALGWVDDPFLPAESRGRLLLVLDEVGYPVPPARLDAELALGPADSANAFQLFHVGIHAARRARWQAVRDVLDRLGTTAESSWAKRDSAEARFAEALRGSIEGYAWWRRGRRDTALALLQGVQRSVTGDSRRDFVNTRLRWWIGLLLEDMRRPAAALIYLESLARTPLPVDYQRGRIYEQLGELQAAREAYALFLAPRHQADSAFQPMIRDARAALRRLAGTTSD